MGLGGGGSELNVKAVIRKTWTYFFSYQGPRKDLAKQPAVIQKELNIFVFVPANQEKKKNTSLPADTSGGVINKHTLGKEESVSGINTQCKQTRQGQRTEM